MAGHKSAAAAREAWVCFADETGHILRPAKGRTWSRRGRTPVVVVSGRARSPRVSIAGLLCYRPGHRPRLLYRMLRHRGRPGEPKGFAAQHLCALPAAAHARLGASIVLVWDNLPAHRAGRTQKFIAAHADWLTVYPLPSYAPELNPAEGVWAHLKSGVLVNLAVHGLDHLVGVVKTALRQIQCRARLIGGFLAGTGLILEPPYPQISRVQGQ